MRLHTAKIFRSDMKNLILAAMASLCLLACHKSETDSASSYWKIGSKSFIPKTIAWANNTFYATDSVGLFALTFSARPTSSGVYYPIGFRANDGIDDFSAAAPTPVQITFNSGKATVEITNAWVLRVPMFQDSLQLVVHLVEQ